MNENSEQLLDEKSFKEYAYNDFSILLPADHMLPIYQKHNLKYDKFLPHLAKYLSASSVIMDIGANCGDTLAGMVQNNPHLTYICIEGDDVFFGYLQNNIVRMKNAYPFLEVMAINHLVGETLSNVRLEGSNGTKKAVRYENEVDSIQSVSLNKVITDLQLRDIDLLKIDVDGYDYDVINSLGSCLDEIKPLLFFECYYDFIEQKWGYEKTIIKMKSAGYDDWTLFDNFGELIIRTNNIDTIFQLMDYIWRLNLGTSTRTIFYYDILAGSRNKHGVLIDNILNKYTFISNMESNKYN